MFSQQPNHFFPLGSIERAKRLVHDRAPRPLRNATPGADLHVKSLKHSKDRHRLVPAGSDTHGIDHPCPWAGVGFLDDEVRQFQISMEETRSSDRCHDSSNLHADLSNVCRFGLPVLEVRQRCSARNKVQFQDDHQSASFAVDARALGNPGGRDTGLVKPSPATDLALGLGDAEQVLAEQPGGKRPGFPSPLPLSGPLHQPDAPGAVLLEAVDGMIGLAGHVRSIPAPPRSVRVRCGTIR